MVISPGKDAAMTLSENPDSLEVARAEKDMLDSRLDEALRAFAAFEEQMNHRWHEADAETRQHLLAERVQVEESLGIAELVDQLEQVRQRLLRLTGDETTGVPSL